VSMHVSESDSQTCRCENQREERKYTSDTGDQEGPEIGMPLSCEQTEYFEFLIAWLKWETLPERYEDQ
jgi:hypothetical protein